MASNTVPTASSPRGRLRDVIPGIHIGTYPTGPKNGLTDVPGVLVHTQELFQNNGAVNTGVTTILPRQDWFNHACWSGFFRFNGSGEMTGSHWIEETGLLASPIVLTNSFSVGACYEGIYRYAIEQYDTDDENGIGWFLLPVVGETFDGWLNDLSAFAVKPEHVVTGIKEASSAPVREGNTGGGTGMICQGHKGGTGTSSRQVPRAEVEGKELSPKQYTVAALVQANYGRLQHLRIAGVPVGRILADERAAAAAAEGKPAPAPVEADQAKEAKDGSIIVVLATDAPLSALQCQRLAKRATVGLARVGGYGHNPSGDIFLAFSTANEIPVQTVQASLRAVDPFVAADFTVEVVDDQSINALFEAAADATEEAIYNTLCAAETMVGFKGHTIEALDHEKLKKIMDRYMYKGPEN